MCTLRSVSHRCTVLEISSGLYTATWTVLFLGVFCLVNGVCRKSSQQGRHRSGGWSGAKDGPYAWGLCYNQELAPEQDYCKTDLLYPCAPGAGYYGRGAFPLYWNYNYGPTGVALKQDLLHHPEILSNNATIAWQAAIWYWMTPAKTRPSPHDVMIGKWVPSKNDTLLNRKPGFGFTINIKASDVECGHGDDPRMLDRMSHYLYFLKGYFGVDDPGTNLDCGLQGVLPLAYAEI